MIKQNKLKENYIEYKKENSLSYFFTNGQTANEIKKTGQVGNKVSDIITQSDIESWQKENAMVLITSGTGSGKTYFVTEVLNKVGNFKEKQTKPKILILQHRLNNVNQTKLDTKHKNVKVSTYQSLDGKLQSNINEPTINSNTSKCEINLDKFDFIVCDECQYFVEDALFNTSTDIAIYKIMESTPIKIFMTATPNKIIPTLKLLNSINNYYKTIYEYTIPYSYDYIHNVRYYFSPKREDKDNYLKRECAIIDDVLSKNEKVIFFINDKQKASDLYKLYKNEAMYNCSTFRNENRQLLSYAYLVDNSDRKECIETAALPKDKSILITTSCMDAGVNINDKSVKTLVCDNITNTSSIIQCIGRKRIIDNTDYIRDLYITPMSNKQLKLRSAVFEKPLKYADDFMQNSTVGKIDIFLAKYYKRHENNLESMVYAVPKNISETRFKLNLMYWSNTYFSSKEYDTIINYNTDWSHCSYINEIFQRENIDDYTILDLNGFGSIKVFEKGCKPNKLLVNNRYDEVLNTLKHYCENGTLFEPDERYLIYNLIKLKHKGNSAVIKNKNMLNKYLKQSNISYEINQFNFDRVIKGKRKHCIMWKIAPRTDS